MDVNVNTFEQVRGLALETAVRFGPRLLVALAIVIAGVIASGWIGRAAERAFSRFRLDPSVLTLLVRVTRGLTVGLFIIVALQNLGVELLPLIAGISVAGAGIALATQGVLSNIAAGLTIIFTKPFGVGDYIEIAGVQGEVTAIRLGATTLLHADQSNVVVPNRKIVGEILHNYGRIRQVEVQVGVAYSADLGSGLAAIRALVEANPRVLREPTPVVQIASLADSAIQIAVRPWVSVADFAPATGELNLAIVDECRRRGIAIPFPQREVRLLGAA